MPTSKRTYQEQNELLIEAAIKCIEETSLLDFTMASIAKEAKLSMGTVYKHVQSKEDVLVAICSKMLKHQAKVFKDMLSLPLTMPERLLCNVLITPSTFYKYSFGVQLEMLCSSNAVLKRASKSGLNQLTRCSDEITATFQKALKHSCMEGEINVKPEETQAMMDTLSMGLWSMSVGFIQVAHQIDARQPDVIDNSLPFPMKHELPYPMPADHGIVKSAFQFINTFPWETPLDINQINNIIRLLDERGYR